MQQVEDVLEDGGVGLAVVQAGRLHGARHDLFKRRHLNFAPKSGLEPNTNLVDEAAAEVGEGDALDEPGVQPEEVVDRVGVVPVQRWVRIANNFVSKMTQI